MRRAICREIARDDRGISVVAVLLIGVVLSMILATLFLRDTTSLNRVSDHQGHQRAIQTAEDGIEQWVGVNLATAPDAATQNDDLDPNFQAWSKSQKRDWIIAHAEDEPLTDTPEGQWAVVKPPGGADCETAPEECVLFSVGYIPSKAERDQVRVVQVEYDLTRNVAISQAILTDGDLKIGGNPIIDLGPAGSIHANGNNYPSPPVSAMEISGNPRISGSVSTSGTCTVSGSITPSSPGCQSNRPKQVVPVVNPRNLHNRAQYDMCPDGRVRKAPGYVGPDPPPIGSPPCFDPNGAERGDLYFLADASSSPFLGWKRSGTDTGVGKKGAIWDYQTEQPFDGIFYFYQGMAIVSKDVGKNQVAPWEVTLIAETNRDLSTGSEPSHCPHTAGDIEISGSPRMRSHSLAGNVLLAAGRDLKVSGNPTAAGNEFAGVMLAHEQFQYSGNARYSGAIISNDYCKTNDSGIHQNEINGDLRLTNPGNLEVDLGTAEVRIVRWLEL